jgi:hydrogenase/urease accessory protein HupE
MIPSHLGLPFDLSVSRVFPFLEEQIAAKVALFNLCIAIRAKSMAVLVLEFSGAMATDGYRG